MLTNFFQSEHVIKLNNSVWWKHCFLEASGVTACLHLCYLLTVSVSMIALKLKTIVTLPTGQTMK